MNESYDNNVKDEPLYEEISDFMEMMDQRLMGGIWISHQDFLLSSFLYAYLNQDVSDIDEAINDFKRTATKPDIQLLVEALDKIINMPYSSQAKGHFLSEATSGHISPWDWLKDLEYIKSELLKK